MYWVYILECDDKSLYTGITNDLERRFTQHQKGRGGHYTSSRQVVRFVYTEQYPDRSSASKREYEIKSLRRENKLHLINSAKRMATKSTELPVLLCKSQKAFELWLQKNHSKSKGVWLRFFKKESGKKTFHYAEALDVALCYGWIDSQAKTYDDESYIQKFTPRGAKSIWSKRNKTHVARLIKEKRMKPAGLAQVEAAKKDGRWDGAYDSPKNMQVPTDFLELLSKNKKALAFFTTLNKANVYAIAWRLQTAKKPETRAKRMTTILEMLKKGQKFH